jgi:competence protein ComEC
MRWRPSAFFGRHPLFGAAMAASLCVLAAGMGPLQGWGAVLLILLLAGACLGWRSALGWGLCAGVSVAVFSLRSERRQSFESALPGTAGWVSAEILENPKGGERYWSAPARLTDGGHPGARVRLVGHGVPPVAGSQVRASGKFSGLPAARNPGEFDEGKWLRRQGIAAIFVADRRAIEIHTGERAAALARIRAGFREVVAAGLDEDSAQARTIRAVVLGEHPPDGGALALPYRLSGTLHVFSVSGLHVGMVGLLGWLLLSWLGVPRRWAVLGMLPLVFGYAWITGNGAPAMRAAWMMTVFLGAFVLRRKPDALNALGAVLLVMMLWDGRLLFQPGVQLSYGVVAAISLGASFAARGFQWMRNPELHLPDSLMTRGQRMFLKFRAATAQSLAVSTAAWIGSTPLTIKYFGLITPASIPATVVLVPMVFVLLAAALLSAALHPVWPAAARAVTHVNGHLASACGGVASGFAALPGSHFHVNRASAPMLLVYDLEFGAGAACFTGGDGGGVLIDCGDRRSLRRQVLASLQHFAIEPDSVVISHPDGSHLGGGEPVWELLPIRQTLLPVEKSLSPAYRRWLDEAPAAGVKLLQAAKFSAVPMPDGARLEVIFSPPPLALQTLADDRVAIYRLHWRGWKILFINDGGHSAEAAILRAGTGVAADVIVAGRHSRDSSLGDDFLDAVGPQAIIASNAPFPLEERLPPRQADYWRSRGIQVVDQRRTGAATLRMDAGGGLVIEGFVDGSTLRLTRR